MQPTYFEPIYKKTVQRWVQLEQDPELAAPWHQLFKQVQSPRHVLSELLQNADDAGATEARVRIENDVFIFEHNGEDFTEEHFASLCRFGYSNKRSLHTIGFRGIGFKSTFSLGDCVELFTPTLAVSFHRQRFTEPRWQSGCPDTHGKTRIRVVIRDSNRQKEIEKNLSEWLKSPLSLLFFKHIRQLQIGDCIVHWRSVGPGPVARSEWMALEGQNDQNVLLLRSEAEAFPEEALTEIREERLLGVEDHVDLPPTTIELVLGAKGQLFVVLPTGIETELPFACNAPFIQDPARLKIKDPETSPTNRWLLERAGQLAASAMLSWLGQSEMSIEERSHAYTLLPDVDQQDTTLQGLCGATVERACAEAIAGQPILLTDDGKLTCEKASVIIPEEICAIWPAQQVAIILDAKGRPPLCQHVAAANQEKLRNWDVVEQIDKQMLLRTLQSQRLPKPQTWRQLLNLWAYIAPEITRHWPYVNADTLRIVPIQGKDVLYAANDVVRLGEKKLLQSDEDWQFLATHLRVLNQNWPRFLAEQRRSTAEDATLHKAVDAAYAVLRNISLDETSDVTIVIKQVADTFFDQKQINVQACVQLTQIAAKLGASVGNAFRYMTRDGRLNTTSNAIFFDQDATLEDLLPEHLRESRILHPQYTASYGSCSREEWMRWASSSRSGLLTFVPFVQKRLQICGQEKAKQEVRKRSSNGYMYYPYVTHQFIIEDWSFEDSYWQHWGKLAEDDKRVWGKIVEHILNQSSEQWKRANSARLLQVATTGTERAITHEALLPNWVLRLRDLPCLPDTRGFLCKPGDLLRRTTETESLMDVEPFVHGRLDTETTRPLLDLLGVRSTPAGPDRLIERLRALAKAEKPPVHEVEKWYGRLDQMLDTCSTTDFEKIKQLFWTEKLVLTQDGGWATAATVFLSADEEDVPGVDVIRPSVCDLTLWRKIGVAERATAEQAMQWLKGLPSGRVLAQDDARRARALLGRYPHEIWEECHHWLDLAGEWAQTSNLRYALTMQSLVPWRHLHQWVKQKTADLQRFSGEVTGRPPFADLLPLAFHLEEQLQQDIHVIGRLEQKAWMVTLGTELQRIQLDSEKDTQLVRAGAQRLTRTAWQAVQHIDVVPYLNGTPAGTARQADVLWSGQILYVTQIAPARLAKYVPEEIGKIFSCDDSKVANDIKAALAYSFERSPEQVQAYLEANFKLAPRSSTPEEISKEPHAHTSELPPTSLPEPDVGTSSIAEPDVTPSDIATSINNAENETPISIMGDVQDDAVPLGQSDDAEEEPPNDVSQTPVRPRPAPKPAQPSMMERFAKAHSFRKDGDSRFVHKDGSWMGRTNGAAFPWERRTATGNLLCYYWAKELCLEHEPLQLEAEIWGMLDHQPAMYALILVSIEGEPIEMTGARLLALRDEGNLILYPAAYRLVYNNDNNK